jgi:hypothetical protein
MAHSGELTEYLLKSIHISCATDTIGHKYPSRHAQKKAVDISRINGKRMCDHVYTDVEVATITTWLQTKLGSCKGARENYGPHIKEKSGVAREISGHKDHIHFSVD